MTAKPASIRILMVEDNAADAALAEREVRRADVFCTVVRVDSQDALRRALQDLDPDVVLTDHSLPGFGARDAMRIVGQIRPGTPVIVVTGALGDEPAVEYLQAGAADYVLKDDLKRLGPAVLRALDGKRSREDQGRAQRLQEATFKIAQVALATPQLETLLPAVHQIIRELMPAEDFYIALHDPATDTLAFPYHVDKYDGVRTFDMPAQTRPVGKTLTDYVLRTRSALLATSEVQRDLERQGLVQPRGTPAVDWLGVPLVVGERVIGVLVAQSYSTDVRLGEREKHILEFVSGQVAMGITRSRAEADLRASQARLTAIIDTALDAVITMGGDGKIRSWSPQAQRIFGWSGAEAVGRILAETIVPPQYRELHRSGLARVVGGAEGRILNQRLEISGLHRDGHEIPLELTVTAVRLAGGEPLLFSAFVRDLTERKKTEDALRAGERKYRDLVESAPIGMYQATRDGRILSANPALARMLGYDAVADLLPHNMREIYVDPRERDELVATFDASGATIEVEKAWKRKNGSHIQVAITFRALRDAAGQLVNFQGFVRDITERDRLESQLRQAQKMEAVGRLAGGVAHDFNNLLTAVLGSADLLLDVLPAANAGRAEAEEIRKAALRAADLTRQLLAFSRQQVLAPRVLSLNAVVAEVDKMLRRVIGEDVDLRTILAPDLGATRADPGQLEQVIMNLAVNARDAMPDGGKLTIETANVELDETYTAAHAVVQPGSYVLLAVTDTGTGMDAETQARIFEPFFTTKPRDKGTGLGLATVYGIVKQSEGHVWAYSEPGRGTTFKVYLPRIDAAPERLREPAATGTVPVGSETILLVEDQVEVRNVTRRLLAARGYQVLVAGSGDEALRLSQQHTGPLHLLLTDVVMPGRSGGEVARLLTAARPSLKVLYLSGYTDESIVHHGVLDPGVAFLQKPFTAEALARKVREVIDATE